METKGTIGKNAPQSPVENMENTPIKKIRAQYSEYSSPNSQNDVSDWREALNKFKINISNVSREKYSLKSRLYDNKKQVLQNSGESLLQKRSETEIPSTITIRKKYKSHFETMRTRIDKENEKSNPDRARVNISYISREQDSVESRLHDNNKEQVLQKRVETLETEIPVSNTKFKLPPSVTVRKKYKLHTETMRMKIDKENVKKEIKKSYPIRARVNSKQKSQRNSLKKFKDNPERTNEKEVDDLPEVDTYESFIAKLLKPNRISLKRKHNRDIKDVGSYLSFKAGNNGKRKFKLHGFNSSLLISGNLVLFEELF